MNIILYVLFIGFRQCLCFHGVYRIYFYINELKNWTDAQQYCRQHYSDLATFTSMEEINRLSRPFTDYAWIGLVDDTASWKGIMGNESNSWRWSATGATSPGGYQKWGTSEPNNADGQSYCAKMQSGFWGDMDCANKYYFVCFNESAESRPKQYFSVSIALTWKDARSYCRQHYTDLAMIKDETENSVVASFYPTGPYWIGLYREGWRWSDGTNSTFTNWLIRQPNNYGAIQYCVQEDNTHEWNDWPCDNLQYFLCHKSMERKNIHRMNIKLQTTAELSDAALLTQIVPQIKEKLESLGLSDFKVYWTVPPTKHSIEAATGQLGN